MMGARSFSHKSPIASFTSPRHFSFSLSRLFFVFYYVVWQILKEFCFHILFTPTRLNTTTGTFHIMGSLSNYVGDDKRKVKKGIGVMTKTTILPVHHAFLNISSPSLYDYNVKLSTETTLAPEGRSQIILDEINRS